MDRDRVVSYLAAMTDDELHALQADARAQPTHPLAQVRQSVAAKAAQLAAQPRTASGFSPPVRSLTGEPEPQPTPEQPAAQGTSAPNRGQGYAGSSAVPPVKQSVLSRIADKLNRMEGNE